MVVAPSMFCGSERLGKEKGRSVRYERLEEALEQNVINRIKNQDIITGCAKRKNMLG